MIPSNQEVNCPLGVLPDSTVNACYEPWALEKFFVFQVGNDATNIFDDSVNDIRESASWSLFTATDDTKIYRTPKPLEAVTWADPGTITDGVNSDRAEIQSSTNPQVVTAIMRGVNPDEVKALKKLRHYLDLTVYLFDTTNRIKARQVSATTYAGIKISPRTFNVVSNYKLQDTGEFVTMLMFTLPEGWDESAYVLIPEDGFDTDSQIRP